MFKYLEILPRVYFLKFDEFIDIGLTFWRYQEYYESKFFRGRVFTLVDFIHNYYKKNDNDFDYFGYWDGFNIPSSVLKEVWRRKIKDENKYDAALRKFDSQVPHRDYYVISSFAKSNDTRNHELAHGLYYTNPDYKREITRELSRLPVKSVRLWKKVLRKAGYHKAVYRDELQAYLVSGEDEDMEFKGSERFNFRFQKIFDRYSRSQKSLTADMKLV